MAAGSVFTSEMLGVKTLVVQKHCTALMEFMYLKCRPFYLPREFTAILLAAVSTPPPL